jgi:arylsulfatase A-like enzyme
LEDLLKALDTEVGKENYTLFLTADHGVAEIPNYLKRLKIPAGYSNTGKMKGALKIFCQKQFGDSLVTSVSNQQVFLNEPRLNDLKLEKDKVEKQIVDYLLSMEEVAEAYTSGQLRDASCIAGTGVKTLIAAGYNFKRSGNVAFAYLPAWFEALDKGTTHGAAYNYDTHVPLIFYGFGIRKGESLKMTHITEIAPTISFLLNQNFPNACFSKPFEEVLKMDKKNKDEKKKKK